MAAVNLNSFAKEIASMEGLKDQVEIGDIKEILKIVFEGYTLEEVVKVWQKYNKS